MDLYQVKRRSLFTWYTTRNGAPLDLTGYLGKPHASSRDVAESYAQGFARWDEWDAKYGLTTRRPPCCELSEPTVKVVAREALGLVTLATYIAMICEAAVALVKALW